MVTFLFRKEVGGGGGVESWKELSAWTHYLSKCQMPYSEYVEETSIPFEH